MTTGDMHESPGEHGGGAALWPRRKLSGIIGQESKQEEATIEMNDQHKQKVLSKASLTGRKHLPLSTLDDEND